MSIHSAADVFAPRLPVPIKGIQNRFSRCPDLWESPGNWLRLALILVSYTPLSNPEAPLVFNRTKPADTLNVSIRTIGRYLNGLEEAGLILRVQQQKFADGSWGCTAIMWSPMALQKYFYPVTSLRDFSKPDRDFGIDLGRGTKMSHKSNPIIKNKVKNKSPCGEILLNTLDQEKTIVISGSPSLPGVPKDLVEPALTLGLKRELVVTLMSRCKTKNIRLQDVLNVVLPAMIERKLKGNEAFAWLLGVINTGRDFAWVAKLKKKEDGRESRKHKRESFVSRVESGLAKAHVRLPSGIHLLGDGQGSSVRCQTIENGKIVDRYIDCRTLAIRLIRNHPFWVRNLLRGKIATEYLQTQNEPAGRNDYSKVSRTAPPVLSFMKTRRFAKELTSSQDSEGLDEAYERELKEISARKVAERMAQIQSQARLDYNILPSGGVL